MPAAAAAGRPGARPCGGGLTSRAWLVCAACRRKEVTAVLLLLFCTRVSPSLGPHSPLLTMYVLARLIRLVTGVYQSGGYAFNRVLARLSCNCGNVNLISVLRLEFLSSYNVPTDVLVGAPEAPSPAVDTHTRPNCPCGIPVFLTARTQSPKPTSGLDLVHLGSSRGAGPAVCLPRLRIGSRSCSTSHLSDIKTRCRPGACRGAKGGV